MSVMALGKPSWRFFKWGLRRAGASQPVTVSRHGNLATIRNGLVRVDYDLSNGNYSVADQRKGGLRVGGAYSRWGDEASTKPGLHRACESRNVPDALGTGKILTISCTPTGGPTYVLDLILYRGSGRLVLGC